jgi:hypothetical protein
MGFPMSSLAEFIAAIMLWLSSMALCQFGMAVEHQAKSPPKAERVALSQLPKHRPAADRLSDAHGSLRIRAVRV